MDCSIQQFVRKPKAWKMSSCWVREERIPPVTLGYANMTTGKGVRNNLCQDLPKESIALGYESTALVLWLWWMTGHLLMKCTKEGHLLSLTAAPECGWLPGTLALWPEKECHWSSSFPLHSRRLLVTVAFQLPFIVVSGVTHWKNADF